MKKRFILLGLLFLHFGILSAQYVIKSQDELAQLTKLPLEKVYVHYNAPVLFPGEYVYYSLYCINAQTNKLSNISSMAYIELVGEDLTTQLVQKVRLEGGRGQGDFFIPVSMPSGNYKLIAYTRWMKNAGQEQLFKDDIAIINPYRSDQEAVLATEADSIVASNAVTKEKPQMQIAKKKKDDGTIVLMTDKKQYGQREKVALVPRNFKGPLGYGNYSISVRKLDALSSESPLDASDYSSAYLGVDKAIDKSVNDSIFLPEQRGELFFGKVFQKEADLPAVDKTVVISIPGTDFQIQSAITDKDGNFYTYVRKEYGAEAILAQVVDDVPDNYKVEFSKEQSIDYTGLDFGNFKISLEDKNAIVKRSVNNQIENVYYSVKPDSILSINTKDPFDGGVPVVIELDDYTRFNTLRETLVEVVENVWVKKLPNGKYTFWVREDNELYDDSYAGDPPLVLVDGVFIPNHDNLLDFNARTIKRLSILRDPLVMGSKKYHGMVAIETINGDYLETEQAKAIAKKPLTLPVPKKNYFRQRYDDTNGAFERIPDFRYQLFWEPEVAIQGEEMAYEFYTSDVPGEYEIVLEGFTTYGKPISSRESFVVE